jgi:hypothetical protein
LDQHCVVLSKKRDDADVVEMAVHDQIRWWPSFAGFRVHASQAIRGCARACTMENSNFEAIQVNCGLVQTQVLNITALFTNLGDNINSCQSFERFVMVSCQDVGWDICRIVVHHVLYQLKDVSSQTSPPPPGWLDGLRIAGDIAAALVIALAVDAVFSSVNGTMRRSRLREMIHELIEPRIELKRRNMVTYQVKTTLRSIIDSLNAMKLIPGITSKQISELSHNLVEKYIADIKNITNESAIAELANFDLSRRAWTLEDH